MKVFLLYHELTWKYYKSAFFIKLQVGVKDWLWVGLR